METDLPACEPASPQSAQQPDSVLEGDWQDMEVISGTCRSTEAFSQPPPNASRYERLLWLRQQRLQTQILWVQCDACDKWRSMPTIFERTELPEKWYCSLHPEKSLSSCSKPEMLIPVHVEADLIYSKYSVGSIVLARYGSWPWWPAMIEDCPDTEQYFWTDALSDIPTHYNVTFFDVPLTRGWVKASRIKNFTTVVPRSNKQSKNLKQRLATAYEEAEQALLLSRSDRLDRYSFLRTLEGPTKTPKSVKKHVKKYKKLINNNNSDMEINFKD
ncbi:unnamed protein product [Leptosia nina]|uniref:Zinc finger CW-type PWWP domain protein 1 n=1 Tax=Leptosia nina TaxID=320188 RepID=A0AAV1J8P2_9NEOP